MGFITAALLCGIAIFAVCLLIGVKRDQVKEKAYREQNITEVIWEDAVLGKVTFEKDTAIDTLTCRSFPLPFGGFRPEVLLVECDETRPEFYFESLRWVFEHQTQITAALFEGFLDAYSGSEEVTQARLKENFGIDRISIEKRGPYFLEDTTLLDVPDHSDSPAFDMEGDPEDWIVVIAADPNQKKLFRNYHQTPVAYVDCETKALLYVWEE